MIFIFVKIKMSISYHGVVGFGSGKVSLPSVDSWNYDLAVLRDPPKSIHTRKIDKPGQTSDITQMIQDSSDRACEAIMVYARGVNPMVGVSYDNYGNNGGQKSGNVSQQGLNLGGNKAAYLPYRIMNGGAFRPPVRDQRELLPLSRQPRVWTQSFTQPGFADYSKKVFCTTETGDELRMVKKPEQVLKGNIRPTAVYKLETPIVENYEVKYVLKNPVQVQGFSGIQPNAKFNAENGNVYAQVLENPLKPNVNLNMTGDRVKDIDLSNFNTNKYTQEVLHKDVQSKLAKNISITPIDDLMNTNRDNYTHEILNAQALSNVSKNISSTPIDELLNTNRDNYTHEILDAQALSNASKNIFSTPIDNLMNTNRDNYTHEILDAQAHSNISKNISVTSIGDLINFDTDRMIKDEIPIIDYTIPEKGPNKYDYMHADPNLARPLPYHFSRTNIGKNIHKRLDNQSVERVYTQNRPMPNIMSNSGGGQKQRIDTITRRDINLRPTVTAGGFDPTPTIPTTERENRIIEFDTLKSNMRKNIYEMQQDRNVSLGNIPYMGTELVR
jgi:hypothetical protein